MLAYILLQENFRYQQSRSTFLYKRFTSRVIGPQRESRGTKKISRTTSVSFYRRLRATLKTPCLYLSRKDDEVDPMEHLLDFIPFPLLDINHQDADLAAPSLSQEQDEAFSKKSAKFSERLFANPKDIDLWLEFIDFQVFVPIDLDDP